MDAEKRTVCHPRSAGSFSASSIASSSVRARPSCQLGRRQRYLPGPRGPRQLSARTGADQLAAAAFRSPPAVAPPHPRCGRHGANCREQRPLPPPIPQANRQSHADRPARAGSPGPLGAAPRRPHSRPACEPKPQVRSARWRFPPISQLPLDRKALLV